jgi:hypothetical protein
VLKLPKVEKGLRRALSGLESTRKVVAGVALALGLTVVGLPGGEVQVASAAPVMQAAAGGMPGALLLAPTGQAEGVVGYHYSHSSHESHSSHASHHSHYSSRY